MNGVLYSVLNLFWLMAMFIHYCSSSSCPLQTEAMIRHHIPLVSLWWHLGRWTHRNENGNNRVYLQIRFMLTACYFTDTLHSKIRDIFFFFSDYSSNVQDGLFGIQAVVFPLQSIQKKTPPQPPLPLMETEFNNHSEKKRGHGNIKMVMLHGPHYHSKRKARHQFKVQRAI